MKEKQKKEVSDNYIGLGLCSGVAFDAAFGVAFDDVGLGICLGLVFGVAMQNRKNFENKTVRPT